MWNGYPERGMTLGSNQAVYHCSLICSVSLVGYHVATCQYDLNPCCTTRSRTVASSNQPVNHVSLICSVSLVGQPVTKCVSLHYDQDISDYFDVFLIHVYSLYWVSLYKIIEYHLVPTKQSIIFLGLFRLVWWGQHQGLPGFIFDTCL